MTVLVGLLACAAPFAIAAWYRDRRSGRDTGRALDDARADICRMDRHRDSLAVQAASLRRQIGIAEAALEAMTRRADDLRHAWHLELRRADRAEQALAEQSARWAVAEAEAVVADVMEAER